MDGHRPKCRKTSLLKMRKQRFKVNDNSVFLFDNDLAEAVDWRF